MEKARTVADLFADIRDQLQLEIRDGALTELAEFSQLEPETAPGTTRGTEIRLASDGSVDATYRSWKNLLKIDFAGAKDIVQSNTDLVVAASSAALYNVAPWVLLLSAAYYVYKGTLVDIHPSDAKTLFAILKMERTLFSRQELNTSYEQANGEPMDSRFAARSIDRLLELGIIEARGDQNYKLTTNLTLQRQ